MTICLLIFLTFALVQLFTLSLIARVCCEAGTRVFPLAQPRLQCSLVRERLRERTSAASRAARFIPSAARAEQMIIQFPNFLKYRQKTDLEQENSFIF